MNLPVFGQDLEELVQEIFVVIIHLERESGFIAVGATGHLAGNSTLAIVAEVAVDPFRMLNLEQVRRGHVNTQLQPIFSA